jgi:cell division protease FtsH
MDGFDPAEGLVIIGATNRPEILDPALLRAGRFDRRVIVDRPDKSGRVAILHVHLKKVKTAPDLDVDRVAQLCVGFTGADLQNLVNEAALLATRRGADEVELRDFESAVERVVAGPQKKSRALQDEERTRVAYHELGHALASLALPGTDPVQKVSIIPRSIGALGYTMQRPEGDRHLMTREELRNKMVVLLGGRAAEVIFFEDISTGASDDLQKVTEIARSMVTRYGMTDELGLLAYEKNEQSPAGLPMPMGSQRSYAEATAREIDQAARAMVDELFSDTKRLLEAHEQELRSCAERLLEQESMGEAELRAYLSLPEPTGSREETSDGDGLEPTARA